MGRYGAGLKTVHPAAMRTVRVMGDEIMATVKTVAGLNFKIVSGQGRHRPLWFFRYLQTFQYGTLYAHDNLQCGAEIFRSNVLWLLPPAVHFSGAKCFGQVKEPGLSQSA